MRPEALNQCASNNPIGNRARDLHACSAVPQQTAPSRTFPHSQHKEWMYSYAVNVIKTSDVNVQAVVGSCHL
jgi:hypothetical protein